MPKYSDYFESKVSRAVVAALFSAYHDNQANYDELIGNTPTSYGVAVWQSLMHNLERDFGSIVGAETF